MKHRSHHASLQRCHLSLYPSQYHVVARFKSSSALVIVISAAWCLADDWLKEGRRPLPADRKFVSKSVDNYIKLITPKFKSANVSRLFSNCLPNTLDTTVIYDAKALDTFVVTGDIPAMWLRDSTNQVLPYLQFAREDFHLRQMICGDYHQHAYNLYEAMVIASYD